eukprot:GCRY01004771.1.p1 GENE.GCRY01004771.1~~GCRY01004771.1.p1  ORF type:complete len:119 (+),score=13.12 GCRY01004771.1:117-473(+)
MADPVIIKCSDSSEDLFWTRNCGLCRNPLNEPCERCSKVIESTHAHSSPLADVTAPKKSRSRELIEDPEECIVIVGLCHHQFHKHCMEEWLKTHTLCPLDGEEWNEENCSKENFDKSH